MNVLGKLAKTLGCSPAQIVATGKDLKTSYILTDAMVSGNIGKAIKLLEEVKERLD